MKRRASIFMTLLCLSVFSAAAVASPFTFRARVSGEQEVPPVATSTSGRITLRFDRALRDVDYILTVRKGVAITQVHLHCGQAGSNGPVVATLFNTAPVSGPGGVNVNGRLSKGTLINADVVATVCGDFAISSIASLHAAVREGLIYLNVHSEGNPGGEIRGQIYPR